MLLFSNAYHALGLLFGVPRRTMLGEVPYASAAWTPFLIESLLGVILLFISATLFFLVIFGTVLLPGRKLDRPIEMPVAQPLDERPAPAWLDTWWPWLNGAIALILLSYGPMLYQLFRDAQSIPFFRF
jgi:cytochrome c oxidase subunit 1